MLFYVWIFNGENYTNDFINTGRENYCIFGLLDNDPKLLIMIIKLNNNNNTHFIST